MTGLKQLTDLTVGTQLLVGGDRLVEISSELAARFRPGDTLSVVEATGEILLIPALERRSAELAVTRAERAFRAMRHVEDTQIADFYERFARAIGDDAIWARIVSVNDEDVRDARARGRSTTRLVADDKLRNNVIEGLKGWVSARSQRGRVLETVQHEGWKAELIGAELGVVGFVFEGRPNVVADATGVLSGGNTVVFRIGRDALRTAKAMLELALTPSLVAAQLPEDAVCLIDSPSHASGWALFSDRRLSLAVARGSGEAVTTLAGLAQRAGVPLSLHGTGGAWIMAGASATAAQIEDAVFASLDRKVCNTLNTLCLQAEHIDIQLPAAMAGLKRAAERCGQEFKLHATPAAARHVPEEWFGMQVRIARAAGDVEESRVERINETELGREWEWERSPEISLDVTATLDDAIERFNRYSPQFVACLLSQEASEHEHFFRSVNAPFVGDGFTRWVDGQYALRRPELGLSNWQHGRLFGRGAILSGDSVFTVRTRVRRV